MPLFELQGDDGKTYDVDAPDARSAVQAFKKFSGGAVGGSPQADVDAMDDAAPKTEDPGWLAAAATKGLQGLTFGFGDEIAAGPRALLSGTSYDDALAKERDIIAGAEEHSPVISALSEIVGSLALPGGLAKAGVGLVAGSAAKAAAKNAAAKASGRTVGTLEKVGDVGRRVGAGAVEGAGYGAAYGAGTAEGNPLERVDEAAQGGLLGAGIGGAAGAIAPTLSRFAPQIGGGIVGGTVGATGAPLTGDPLKDGIVGAALGATGGQAARNFFRNKNVTGEASRRIGETVPMRKVEGRVDARPGTAIADAAGAPGEDLLRTAASESGERGTIATKANIDRMSEVSRVKKIFADRLDAPEGAYLTAKNDIMEARASAATPFYQRFYAQPVEASDELTGILTTPNGRAALAQAKRNAANRREAALFEAVDDDGNIVAGAVPNARALDETKRVLDKAVEAAKRPADGSPFARALATPESDAIGTVRDDLVTHLKGIGAGSPPGFIRLYRGEGGSRVAKDGSIKPRGTEVNGAFYGTDREYARKFAKDDNHVFYVDVPKNYATKLKGRVDPDGQGWEPGKDPTIFRVNDGALRAGRKPISAEELSPYAKALDVGGSNIRADEAIEFGRKIFNTDPRAIAGRMGVGPQTRGMKPFGDHEKYLVRVGLVDDAVKRMEGAPTAGDALKRVFGNIRQRAQIKAAFPTKAEFNAFERDIIAAARRAKTTDIARRATGGARMVDEGETGAGPASIARTGAMFGPGAAAWQLVQRAARRAGGLTPKVADEVGRQLMERNPQEVRKILTRIHAIERTKLSKAAKRANIRAAISAVTSGAAGRAASGPEEYRGIE